MRVGRIVSPFNGDGDTDARAAIEEIFELRLKPIVLGEELPQCQSQGFGGVLADVTHVCEYCIKRIFFNESVQFADARIDSGDLGSQIRDSFVGIACRKRGRS